MSQRLASSVTTPPHFLQAPLEKLALRLIARDALGFAERSGADRLPSVIERSGGSTPHR